MSNQGWHPFNDQVEPVHDREKVLRYRELRTESLDVDVQIREKNIISGNVTDDPYGGMEAIPEADRRPFYKQYDN